jgi:hypothetical protein
LSTDWSSHGRCLIVDESTAAAEATNGFRLEKKGKKNKQVLVS